MINKGLLQYLCYPECKSDLIEKDSFWVCEKCGEKYKIQDGIPILIDLDNLPRHLQNQVRYFEKEDKNRNRYRLEE